MKTISAALDSHLNREVTTLCTCWKIVRTDGETFCFTDHDNNITFEGDVYQSETGYTRTAISTENGYSVDNLDVMGFLDSDRISENDLRNGLFDFAKVYIFALNWEDPSQGNLKLRRGWMGEVTLSDNGEFTTEIRGLAQALGHNFMESYTPECRTDFCSTKCKLQIANYTRTGQIHEAFGRGQARLTSSAAAFDPNSVGSHRHWGIEIIAWQNTNHVSFGELGLFDQAGAAIAGGTATATSIFNASTPASAARDGDVQSFYHTVENPAGHRLMIDFGEGNAKDVKSISLRSRINYGHQAPTGFNLIFSDDGINWSVAKAITTPPWASGELRSFSGFTLPLIRFAAPAAGAETYIGGMLKFTSGENTGKVMEIINFDINTGMATFFENFPHPISTGDTIQIAQGCDKRFATCVKYGNQFNFRGEPHVPGQDELMKYPDAK
jgi:uncharacterized phage protein (TIGR02218 family)